MAKNYSFKTGRANGFDNATDTANEEWIYITPNVERFNNIVSNDNDKGVKASDISGDLSVVKSIVTDTGLLVNGETGQAKNTELGNIINEIDNITRTKKRIGKEDLKAEIKKFNDNLEKAKVKAVRTQLRQACETFNHMKKIKGYYRLYDEYGQEIEQDIPEYDVIYYDALITAWDTFLDMRTSTMVKELQAREQKYGIKLIPDDIINNMERPADT